MQAASSKLWGPHTFTGKSAAALLRCVNRECMNSFSLDAHHPHPHLTQHRTFYAWFPLWGVVLSLLYLSSASSSSLRKRGPSDAQDLSHRLIDDDEMERSGAQGGGGAGAYQGRSASGAEHNDVAEPSPGTSFNSGTYSYTYRGQSTSVSQLTNDVFFRDVAAAASARDYQ